MNLIGLIQALLVNINLIAGVNDPQTKITPVGFLKALLENPATLQISNLDAIRNGSERDVKVRYMQRGTISNVSDVDSCDTTITPSWKESAVSHTLYSQIGIFISDADMRKYQEEAAQTLAAGTPSAPLMRGLYETLVVKCNALIQSIDAKLVAAQAAKFGVNVASGSNAAKQIVMAEKIGMDNGYVQLSLDKDANEVVDDFFVVGNGKVVAYDYLQRTKIGADAAGIGALPLGVYTDSKTVSSWGANHFGVFAKGSVGFVDFNKYVGAYAGEKGGSYFFTLPIPVQLANGELSAISFDCQLKYIDCPEYSGETVTQARGWKLIVSKSFGLWNQPTDAYAESDVLAGVNGSFHYVAVDEITPESES